MERTYTWGLDIAGSLTQAGGVGALLEIVDHATGKTYFPTYDGNGNVTSLVNADSGSLAAIYEYSPFGQALRAQVIDATIADQPFRFSTKFWDGETGLYYYGMRFYDSRTGRFVGRDPAEENGGLNLYAFVLNAPIEKWDVLGEAPSDDATPPVKYNGLDGGSMNFSSGGQDYVYDTRTGDVYRVNTTLIDNNHGITGFQKVGNIGPQGNPTVTISLTQTPAGRTNGENQSRVQINGVRT